MLRSLLAFISVKIFWAAFFWTANSSASAAPAIPNELFIAASDGAIILDDAAAQFTGQWTTSTKQKSLVGPAYQHDGNDAAGQNTATFEVTLPTAGSYHVRLLYRPGSNRAAAAKVTIRDADGERETTVDQRQQSRPLGLFRAGDDRKLRVTISNRDAGGFVVVDGLELIPAASVKQSATSAPTEPVKAPPRKPLRVEPVRSAAAVDVAGRSFDVVVVGGTPGGIAAAVRAAREGSSVLLVQHNQHIGGMLTNGLMQWDAIYGGPRAPLFNEVAQGIENYYRDTYGPHSKQFASARYSQQHYPVSRFESSVAEHVLNQLVSREQRLTLLLSHYPHHIVRHGTTLESLTLRDLGTQADISVNGKIYIDATYEGDLAALAKTPYRVGREGRSEFGEPHAGKLFTNILRESGPQDVKLGLLNLHLYGHRQGTVDPSSSGAADLAVQAYNYRFCLTNEDGNRRLPEKPPGYRREEYVNYYRLGMSAGAINGKSTFNAALLPGENHAYPEANWPTRQIILQRHKNFALGLMWFLQNDESVPAASRARYRQIGLPLDEFPDNQNIPYEMYVREGRRIVGSYVFTEHDNRLAAGLARTPIHSDSIAFTDWPMDSHDCSWDRHEGFDFDGKLILTEESRPAHIPYRCLLPQGVDNLLVPVCLSATHVAWGAVRLEPVWMQTGEAAGWAAVLAKRHHTTPAALDPDLLVRTLCQQRHFISFFNELAQFADHPAMPAAQYVATLGLYQDYNARLADPLTADERSTWKKGIAKRWPQLSPGGANAATATRGEWLLDFWKRLP